MCVCMCVCKPVCAHTVHVCFVLRLEDVSNLASAVDWGEMIREEEIGGLKLSA